MKALAVPSQAAFRALNYYSVESKLMWKCLGNILQLANHNKVTFMWIPGHENIKLNEAEDSLAKESATPTLVRPGPNFGLFKVNWRLGSDYERTSKSPGPGATFWDKAEKIFNRTSLKIPRDYLNSQSCSCG